MAEQGINLKELGPLFLEKWPIILVAVAISVGVSWRDAQNIRELYSAKATIQVDYNQSSVLSDIEQVDTQDFSEYDVLNTIVETLTNTKLMEEVIKDHDLLNDVEFAGENAGSASLGELARSLSRRTKAKLREETRLIDLSITHPNPRLARDLINWIAQGFIKQHANRRITSNQFANNVLTNEADRLKLKLRNAEVALIDFRKSSNLVVSLEERTTLLADLISTRTESLNTITAEISLLDDDLILIDSYGEEATHEQLRTVPSISNNELIQEKYANLNAQEGLVLSLEKRYKAKHPRVVQEKRNYEDMLSAFNKALEDSPKILEAKLSQLKVQAKSLTTQVKQAEEESLDLSSKAVEYNVLQREITATQSMYETVLNRIKEIDLTTGLDSEVISVIEEADSASNITEDGSSKIVMGAFFGLAIGMGIIYLLHMLDTTLKSVDQAEQSLELPALGAIPGSEPKNRLAKSRLVLLSDPSSSCAEAFRSLRANIESLGSDEKKITLFTSSMPAEGKTFTCINYALTLAQRGLKTIVIDLDLRHPSVGGEFSFAGDKLNVADVLQDPASFSRFSEEGLENPTENLYVMPVGGQLPNPAEQLANESIINLVRRATEQFDRVIIDSAPLNPVGDTLAIVQLVDVICMVVRCKKTPIRIVERSLETLRRFNSPASGVILNFVPAKKSMGNYYYYYGGGKSPYEGSHHYQPKAPRTSKRSSGSRKTSIASTTPSAPTTPPPSAPSRTLEAGGEGPDIATPPPRHRRRRIRRPAIQPQEVENEVTISQP